MIDYEQRYNRIVNLIDFQYARDSRYETVLRYIKEREGSELKQRAAKTINKNNHPPWKAKLKGEEE